MSRARTLKALFFLNVVLVAAILGYKAYLNLSLPEFEGVHARQIERIDQRLTGRERFSFAVLGNINNSIGIFEKRMIPVLNQASVDFVVSAGNAVTGGGEDKYQALYGTLGHLQVPYLLTFGDHEHQRFGSYRFYEHFGPHHFSFRAANTRFIFLDSTGKTPWRWQIRWLRDLLEQDNSRHRLVFIGHPLFRAEADLPFEDKEDYLRPGHFREALLALFREYSVDAVFSANLATWDVQENHGTRFVTTGGAGDLVLDTDDSFYHFTRVTVSESGGIEIAPVTIDAGQHPLLRLLESLWLFIYSLFYVGYLNFILLVSGLVLVAIKLHAVVFRGPDYYPDYDLDPSPWLDRPLKVAMFTNNFLPFIGGVPIAIDRLRRGLAELGDRVLVIAPRYPQQSEDDPAIHRVPTLLSLGKKREFRVANLLAGGIRARVRAFKPDIIHLHHPFWLGSLGRLLARWLRIPAVYTYHTRLEHYAHFVPLPGLLFRNLISHALVRRFANKCDGVIVPTDATEDYLHMLGVRTPVFVQPTGIEYDRFQQVDERRVAELRESLGLTDETVFVSVARLSSEKNIDFMLDALNELRQKTSHRFRLLMLGEGHERQRLQARTEALGLGQHITFAGAVPPDEMPAWYRLGDAFLFASRSETQGMVILEAMAAGLPVVAVRASGIDDVVRDGYNGYKTALKRSLWCARVQQLLEDPALRAQLAANALAFAGDYSVAQFARNTREIYASVLAASARHHGKTDPANTD